MPCPCSKAIKELELKIQKLIPIATSAAPKTTTPHRPSYSTILKSQTCQTAGSSKQQTPRRTVGLRDYQKITREHGRQHQMKNQIGADRKRLDSNLVGQCNITSLKASTTEVPVKPRTKSLFESRLDVLTTPGEVDQHVQKVLGREMIVKATKLKSQNQDYYSSFHVEVPVECFNELFSSMIWAEGCLIRPYRGILKDYRVFVAGTTSILRKRNKPYDEDSDDDPQAM